ncbi:MAG: hypothetical protein AB7O24_12870 [Kofleriaceae bacterium]
MIDRTTRRSSTIAIAAIAMSLGANAPARADDPPPETPGRAPAAADPAASAAPARALVVHVAPSSSEAGAPVELEAMIDAPFAEALTVRWRAVGEREWHDAEFERSSAGGWYASLPPSPAPGVEYYIRGRDMTGAEVLHFASAEAPHLVRVDPALFDRLEDLDRERLNGHANEIAVEFMGHNFGNRYGIADRFVRGELTFTHRLLRELHHVSFGFGAIDGRTPEDDLPTAGNVRHALRYGFGEVRLRAHPSVFIDLRLALGVSHDGFDQGVRGALTFGKPWRSSVSVGAEYLHDLGASAWVRLQWDTAPPLLMGASIIRTDLPGALVDAAGLMLGYDVAYRIARRLTMRAQLSYGSRDGAAHFGGGLGTAVEF